MSCLDQKLCQAGKAKKLALTMCGPKLLTIVNEMVDSGIPWRLAVSQSVYVLITVAGALQS